jgi:hypothetical protein
LSLPVGFGFDSALGSDGDEGLSDRSGEEGACLSDRSGEEGACLSDRSDDEGDDFSDRSREEDVVVSDRSVDEGDDFSERSREEDVVLSDRSADEGDDFSERSREEDVVVSDRSADEGDDLSERSSEEYVVFSELSSAEAPGSSDRSTEGNAALALPGTVASFVLFSAGGMEADSIGEDDCGFASAGKKVLLLARCDFSTSAFSCGITFDACVPFTASVVRMSRQRNELNGYRNICICELRGKRS